MFIRILVLCLLAHVCSYYVQPMGENNPTDFTNSADKPFIIDNVRNCPVFKYIELDAEDSTECARPVQVTAPGANEDVFFDYGLALCMVLYDVAQRVCKIENQGIDLLKQTYNTSNFCDIMNKTLYELETEVHFVNTTWVSVLKKRFDNRTNCKQACVQGEIINPTCKFILRAHALAMKPEMSHPTSEDMSSKGNLEPHLHLETSIEVSTEVSTNKSAEPPSNDKTLVKLEGGILASVRTDASHPATSNDKLKLEGGMLATSHTDASHPATSNDKLKLEGGMLATSHTDDSRPATSNDKLTETNNRSIHTSANKFARLNGGSLMPNIGNASNSANSNDKHSETNNKSSHISTDKSAEPLSYDKKHKGSLMPNHADASSQATSNDTHSETDNKTSNVTSKGVAPSISAKQRLTKESNIIGTVKNSSGGQAHPGGTEAPVDKDLSRSPPEDSPLTSDSEKVDSSSGKAKLPLSKSTTVQPANESLPPTYTELGSDDYNSGQPEGGEKQHSDPQGGDDRTNVEDGDLFLADHVDKDPDPVGVSADGDIGMSGGDGDVEAENKLPRKSEDPQEAGNDNTAQTDHFEDGEGFHFYPYFMTMMVLCIIGYLVFHNKQKILALALEGRSRRGNRRRPNTSGYRKLDSNLEEAVTSTCSTSVTHVIY